MINQLPMFDQPQPIKSVKGCTLIYTPKGRAREYAALACNVYRGCDHGLSIVMLPQPRGGAQKTLPNLRAAQVAHSAPGWRRKPASTAMLTSKARSSYPSPAIHINTWMSRSGSPAPQSRYSTAMASRCRYSPRAAAALSVTSICSHQRTLSPQGCIE